MGTGSTTTPGVREVQLLCSNDGNDRHQDRTQHPQLGYEDGDGHHRTITLRRRQKGFETRLRLKPLVFFFFYIYITVLTFIYNYADYAYSVTTATTTVSPLR